MFVVDMFIGSMYYEELDAATAARRGLGTVPSRNPFLGGKRGRELNFF